MNLNEAKNQNEISETPFSVKEFEERIVLNYGDKERIKFIANEFRSAKIIYGTAQEFLNFSLSFIHNGDNQTACEILRCGIDNYPYDVELLTCFLSCAIDSGVSDEINICEDFHVRLKEIPLKRYSERALNAILRYLSMKRSFVSPKDYDGIQVEAEEILKMFTNLYPTSEGSYFAHCDFLDNEMEKVSKLKEAVSKLSSCPKCALRLSEILCNQGEYTEAKNTINKCLNSVQTLSKVNLSYVYYLLGVCNYGILINKGIEQSTNDIEDMVSRIYESFRIAKSDYYNLQAVYRREIDKIVYVLEQQVGIAYS